MAYVYDGTGRIAGETEESIFEALDMKFITPEQRERG